MTNVDDSLSELSKGRYAVPVEGAVYDKWGGYFIHRELFDQRIAEGRSDKADHDFVLGERVDDEGLADRWHRVEARCRICGEERVVWHAVDMKSLNSEWCIPVTEKTLRQQLKGLLVGGTA